MEEQKQKNREETRKNMEIKEKEKKINSLSILDIYKTFQNINKFDTIK